MGKLRDTVKGLANEIAGNAKQAAGAMHSDPDKAADLKAEGKVQETKGEIQQGIGKIKGALGDRI
jgi:uncharacterized protein YjbJ (UPF0337 family)